MKWDKFVVYDLKSAMGVDDEVGSRPIVSPANTPEEIDGMFDTNTYQKVIIHTIIERSHLTRKKQRAVCVKITKCSYLAHFRTEGALKVLNKSVY